MRKMKRRGKRSIDQRVIDNLAFAHRRIDELYRRALKTEAQSASVRNIAPTCGTFLGDPPHRLVCDRPQGHTGRHADYGYQQTGKGTKGVLFG